MRIKRACDGAPLKSIDFLLILMGWITLVFWVSFSRASWEIRSIMSSFLFPISSLIFLPLLYHNQIYALIIRHHGVIFFSTSSLNCPLFRENSVSFNYPEVLFKSMWMMRRLKNINDSLMMGIGDKARNTTLISCISLYLNSRDSISEI